MTAVEYCRDKAAPAGSTFYYSTLFYNAAVRRDLYGLYAFLIEIEDILFECSDPGVARIKLAWWGEEIARTGNSEGRHPLSPELHRLINTDVVSASTLSQCIDRNGDLLSGRHFTTYRDILAAYARGSGVIWECMANRCGAHPASLSHANQLGCLFRYFRQLQQVRTLVKNQQFHAPADDLADMAGEPEALLQPGTDNAGRYFARQIDHLTAALDEQLSLLHANDHKSLMLFIIHARIILRTCAAIREEGCRLADQHVSLTPLRKFAIAWWARFTH